MLSWLVQTPRRGFRKVDSPLGIQEGFLDEDKLEISPGPQKIWM